MIKTKIQHWKKMIVLKYWTLCNIYKIILIKFNNGLS